MTTSVTRPRASESEQIEQPEQPTVAYAPVPVPRPQAGDSADYAIWVEGLSKQFGDEVVVNNITFTVPRGKIFGFIGPSGSGKTTVLRLLTGIYEATEGEVIILGYPPQEFDRNVRGRIGYMPQLFVLYPDLTVWENLNFTASIYGMSFFRGERLKEILEFVELDEHSHKLARNISGGMQRRLTLACTLVHAPELLFLDEPTAGVDPVLRKKFWDHFCDLQQQGRTLFITTQYVTEAAYCDLVGVISNGQLVIVDTPDGLRRAVFGGEVVELRTSEPVSYQMLVRLRELPFVIQGNVTRQGDRGLRMVVDDAGTVIPILTDWLRVRDILVESIEEYLPPFDDVFIELVREEKGFV